MFDIYIMCTTFYMYYMYMYNIMYILNSYTCRRKIHFFFFFFIRLSYTYTSFCSLFYVKFFASDFVLLSISEYGCFYCICYMYTNILSTSSLSAITIPIVSTYTHIARYTASHTLTSDDFALIKCVSFDSISGYQVSEYIIVSYAFYSISLSTHTHHRHASTPSPKQSVANRV